MKAEIEVKESNGRVCEKEKSWKKLETLYYW
jgi:hypothetical protein